MKKTRVGIIGGAGYTGGEILRLLLNHDQVEIAFVQSRSQANHPVYKVHTDLLGVSDLVFTDRKQDAADPTLDFIFLALPHGETKKFLDENALPEKLKLIDLSQDFRLESHATYKQQKFVYGLPEVNREKIKRARFVANPGCFATSIELALLPLAQAKSLGKVTVTGITGSTGAGQGLAATSHFSFRANNIQPYKTLTHQHIAEVEETLWGLQGDSSAQVSFIPWRGDFTRGIFVSALIESDYIARLDQDQVRALYTAFYEKHPFISVANGPIDLKSVVNTNRALIETHVEDSRLVVHVALDNLLKGASGQAVQNFNLMMGFPENSGLKLKGVVF